MSSDEHQNRDYMINYKTPIGLSKLMYRQPVCQTILNDVWSKKGQEITLHTSFEPIRRLNLLSITPDWQRAHLSEHQVFKQSVDMFNMISL